MRPDVWATHDGLEVPIRIITHWRCPHCEIQIAIANVAVHTEEFHIHCFGCEAERMLCAQISFRQLYETEHREA